MTREDTAKILAIITTTYPNFKVENKSQTLDAWTWALEDHSYESISLALKSYINTTSEAFPPSVSQLIAMTRKPKELTEMSEGEAWSMVRKGIRNGIYGYVEEFAKFPDMVKKAVGEARMLYHWAQMDSDEIDSVVASNFQRNYRTILKRESEYQAMPKEVKDLIGTMDNKMIEVKE